MCKPTACGLVVRLPGCRPRGPGFYFRRCQIFWVAVDLERGPLSPCENTWGDTWTKSSGSGLENWDSRPQGILHADHATPLSPQTLALNFASKWRSTVGIVRLRTKSHGVCFFLYGKCGFGKAISFILSIVSMYVQDHACIIYIYIYKH
jgi:hypothetical protein